MVSSNQVVLWGIDAGNVFTEISYCTADNSRRGMIRNFHPPNGSKPVSKIPSRVYYDTSVRPVTWTIGWPAPDSSTATTIPCTKFKQWFSKRFRDEQSQKSSRPPWEGITKTWQQVFCDFLSKVYEHIVDYAIKHALPRFEEYWYFSFSFPTSFCEGNVPELDIKTYKDIIASEEHFAQHKDRILIGHESEDAIIYFLKRHQSSFKPKDHVLFIDVKEKDTEFVLFIINKIGSITEVTKNSDCLGKNCGSLSIDYAFKRDLEKFPEASTQQPYETEAELQHILKAFRAAVEACHEHREVQRTLEFPRPGNKNGPLVITGEKWKDYTGESYARVASVTNGLQQQIMDKNLKGIFSTGGMGSIPWFINLMNFEVNESRPDIKFPRTENAASAVCLGSLERGLQLVQSNNMLKRSYAIVHKNEEEPFLEEILQEGLYFDTKAGLEHKISIPYKLSNKEKKSKTLTLTILSFNGPKPQKYDPSIYEHRNIDLKDIDISPFFVAKRSLISRSLSRSKSPDPCPQIYISVGYCEEIFTMTMFESNHPDRLDTICIATMTLREEEWHQVCDFNNDLYD